MTDKIEDLDVMIRLANQTMKDLKAVIKTARETIDELRTVVVVESGAMIATHVKEQIDNMTEATAAAIKEAEKGVYDRFDRIGDILLGETKVQTRAGEPTLADYAETIRVLREGQ